MTRILVMRGRKKRESKVFANAHVWVGCHGSKLIKRKTVIPSRSSPLLSFVLLRFISFLSSSCSPSFPCRWASNTPRAIRSHCHSFNNRHSFFSCGEQLDIRQRRCRVRSLHLAPSVTFNHIRERSLTRNLTRVAPLIATKISGEW